jgi:hypothetical protein
MACSIHSQNLMFFHKNLTSITASKLYPRSTNADAPCWLILLSLQEDSDSDITFLTFLVEAEF